jgi:hypothetical protein
MDLVVAMFANAAGLNTRDLTLRFVPTLFLALSMLSVFCFSRGWLGSGYFGALVVFLVFFGKDFSFVPGLLQGEKGDWSVKYFSVPTVFSLFYTNPMLPALGLLFAGLFCLQSYLRERARDSQSDISSRPEIWSAARSCVFRDDRPTHRTDVPHRTRWVGTLIQQ